MDKLTFTGTIRSVQPRTRLVRSFDEASHNYLGYAISLRGSIGSEEREFSLGIGKAAQEKHQFRIGDAISGACLPVSDEQLEPVEFYKVSQLKKIAESGITSTEPPPWVDVCPDLETYRGRGHRRLAAWNPRGKKKYRFETFCYGPLNCTFYKAGPNRKVEGRNGMVYTEENWVDEQMTSHREPEE